MTTFNQRLLKAHRRLDEPEKPVNLMLRQLLELACLGHIETKQKETKNVETDR